MIAASHDKFPVITYTQTGRYFVVVPAGCRLWLSPVTAGDKVALGFILPVTNPVFAMGLNDPYATQRRIRAELTNSAASSHVDCFYHVAHPYQTETGDKEIVAVGARGTDLSEMFCAQPTQDADARTIPRCTMASYSYDMTVACTYLATALVHTVATDTPGSFKDVRDQTMGDEDPVCGITLRNRLAASIMPNGGETLQQILSEANIKIVGPGQESNCSANVRLVAPQWWFAGSEAKTTVDDSAVYTGRVPYNNPYFGAYQTGSWISVQAVGGDVSVSFQAQRTNHVEYSMPEDGLTNTTAFAAVQMLAAHAHYTSNDPTVLASQTEPRAMIGWGKQLADAHRDLDRNSGVPIGSSRAVALLPSNTPHPPPSVTRAKDLWGEVKGIGETVVDAAKTAAKGVSMFGRAKQAWNAAADIGEFAEALGQLL